jgi:Ca2+-binding RTX toxin-like protein
MSIFTGSNADDTITPELVSADVSVIGSPQNPSTASDLILAGNGDDVVAGGGGDDLVSLGGDNDTFVWRAGDGNDVVDGGSGTDRLVFDGSAATENIAVSAGHLGLARVARDVDNVTMNLTGVERIDIAALDGQDRVTVNDLSNTDVRDVFVDLAGTADPVAGDGQADVVAVNGTGSADTVSVARDGTSVVVDGLSSRTTIEHADASVDRLVINAGGGNDVVAAANGLSTLIQLTIDGGAGNDTISGGDGADLLLGGDGNDVVSGRIGADTAQLGSGDDTFVWNPGDGSDIVEGNSGSDTLQFNGSNIGEEIVLAANGSHAQLTRNVAGVTMDLHGMETVNIKALGGADNITIGDLRGTGIKQVHVDLAGTAGGTAGDEQVDNVTVNGTSGNDVIKLSTRADGALVVGGLSEELVVEHFDPNDVIHIAGLGGHDIIDTSALGVGGPKILFDGADVLIGGASANALEGRPGDNIPIHSIAAGGQDSSLAHFDFGTEQQAPDHEQVAAVHTDHSLL